MKTSTPHVYFTGYSRYSPKRWLGVTSAEPGTMQPYRSNTCRQHRVDSTDYFPWPSGFPTSIDLWSRSNKCRNFAYTQKSCQQTASCRVVASFSMASTSVSYRPLIVESTSASTYWTLCQWTRRFLAAADEMSDTLCRVEIIISCMWHTYDDLTMPICGPPSTLMIKYLRCWATSSILTCRLCQMVGFSKWHLGFFNETHLFEVFWVVDLYFVYLHRLSCAFNSVPSETLKIFKIVLLN